MMRSQLRQRARVYAIPKSSTGAVPDWIYTTQENTHVQSSRTSASHLYDHKAPVRQRTAPCRYKSQVTSVVSAAHPRSVKSRCIRHAAHDRNGNMHVATELDVSHDMPTESRYQCATAVSQHVGSGRNSTCMLTCSRWTLCWRAHS